MASVDTTGCFLARLLHDLQMQQLLGGCSLKLHAVVVGGKSVGFAVVEEGVQLADVAFSVAFADAIPLEMQEWSQNLPVVGGEEEEEEEAPVPRPKPKKKEKRRRQAGSGESSDWEGGRNGDEPWVPPLSLQREEKRRKKEKEAAAAAAAAAAERGEEGEEGEEGEGREGEKGEGSEGGEEAEEAVSEGSSSSSRTEEEGAEGVEGEPPVEGGGTGAAVEGVEEEAVSEAEEGVALTWKESCNGRGGSGGMPTTIDELLHMIGNDNFGISSDRSSTLATPAMKAFNASVETSERVTHKKGQQLPDAFYIIKVSSHQLGTHGSLVASLTSAFVPFSVCSLRLVALRRPFISFRH